MNELKSCPFCGAPAKNTVSRESFDSLVEEHGSACLRIDCTECDACMWVHDHDDGTNYDYLLNKGIRNWNRRAHEG